MNSKLCSYDEVKSEYLRKLTLPFFSSNVENVVHHVVVKLMTNLGILGLLSIPSNGIEWCKEHNLLSSSVKSPKPVWKHGQLAKTKCIGRWICFAMLNGKKTARDNLQSVRTHDFLAVSFPSKNISQSNLWPESVRLPTRRGLTSSHS